MILIDLRFAKSHEWALFPDSENNGGSGNDNELTAIVGISDYAQNALGDIVYVEISAEKNSEVAEKGAVNELRILSFLDCIGVVESVKGASDIYSPVSGEVFEVNSNLLKKPSLINSSPLQDAWFVKVRMTKDEMVKAEETLLTQEQYDKFLKEEEKEHK